MHAYYNEHDAFAADWLRVLIKDGRITGGDVDERDVQHVQPADLRGYDRCHFFAGIGGWDYALQLAGWTDEPVWTGSCPCQPYTTAGQHHGARDARHLWPHWLRLIRECRPPVIFGEQVAGALRHGWLDLVSTELEAAHYAVGAAVLGAHSVGAPHIRQRLFFVAHTDARGRERLSRTREPEARAAESGAPHPWSDSVWLQCSDGKARPAQPGIFPLAHGVPHRVGTLRGSGNAVCPQAAAEVIAAYRELRG